MNDQRTMTTDDTGPACFPAGRGYDGAMTRGSNKSSAPRRKRTSRRTRRLIAGLCIVGVTAVAVVTIKHTRHHVWAKRFVVVEPGGLYRGGYPESWPLKRVLEERRIRTVLSLMDPTVDRSKEERALVEAAGATYLAIQMPGNGDATLEQLDEAADLLADPARRPLFFHCSAGVNRSGIVHAAYLIKHKGWPLDAAVERITRLGARTDKNPEIVQRLMEFRDQLSAPKPTRGTLSDPDRGDAVTE